ncbi:MAG: hypothetical protein ACYCST_07435 [Acidimicrobiales bacterium]
MSNVLIRDVPPEDLEQIKEAAAQRGTTLQAYLWDTVHAQAAYLRRQDALARTAQRLHGRPAVSKEARESVLDAIDAADDERGSWVSQRPSR